MDFIEKRKIKSLLKDCDFNLEGKLLINKFKGGVLEIGLN